MGASLSAGPSAHLNCSRRAYGDLVLHAFPFSLHIRKDLVVNISFFLIFPPALGNDIQGLVHAEQVCHQLNYIPRPGKLPFLKNQNLEASQTFLGH